MENFYISIENKIKERVPDFKIKFKDDSNFMKLLGKLLFFNKSFMTSVTTTIGKTVYFPSKFRDGTTIPCYYSNHCAKILCHEYVHIMDYVRNPFIFILGYLFPQNLSVFSLLALFSFFNLNFLFFVLFLLFLLPLPSPYRTWAELRGYGMSGRVFLHNGSNTEEIKKNIDNYYVDFFTGSSYYYMWPFKKYIIKRLNDIIFTDDILNDSNPAFKDVFEILKK